MGVINEYDALNILRIFSKSATQEEIKHAYRKAVFQYHLISHYMEENFYPTSRLFPKLPAFIVPRFKIEGGS